MTATRERVVLSWSGGKDSAFAFNELVRHPGYEVHALLSYIDAAADRIAQHCVPTPLIRRQAEALGVPLWEIRMPPGPSNEEYERRMTEAVRRMVDEGVRYCAFGDLFLEDVRAYRERNLAGTGVSALFPLWGRDTAALARTSVDLGFWAVVVCVDTEQLDGGFAGREIDAGFARDLPTGVDPCGERGEFHSFVYDGPPFREPIAFAPGDVVQAGRFALCPLRP